MPVVYERTGRVFTLALRTCDAVVSRMANQTIYLEWPNIRWAELFGADMDATGSYVCSHSFRESVHQYQPIDKMFWNIRDRNLVCNLVSYSKVSNVRSTDGLSTDLLASFGSLVVTDPPIKLTNPASNPAGSFRDGFLNRMNKSIYNGVTTNTTNTANAATGRYSFTQSFGGVYTCDPREFECINPEKANSVRIGYLDDIPVRTLADVNVINNGGAGNTNFNGAASIAAAMWGPMNTGGGGVNASLTQIVSTGTTNGFFPSFYTQKYTLGTNAMLTAVPNSEAVIDTIVPQGTHIFTFYSVTRVNIP